MEAAFLYTGQGWQYPGMLRDVPDSAEKRLRFEEAGDVLGRRITDLDAAETMDSNENVQLCIFLAETVLTAAARFFLVFALLALLLLAAQALLLRLFARPRPTAILLGALVQLLLGGAGFVFHLVVRHAVVFFVVFVDLHIGRARIDVAYRFAEIGGFRRRLHHRFLLRRLRRIFLRLGRRAVGVFAARGCIGPRRILLLAVAVLFAAIVFRRGFGFPVAAVIAVLAFGSVGAVYVYSYLMWRKSQRAAR